MTAAQSSRQRLGRRLVNTAAAFSLVYLFAPIAVIVLFSFNKPKGKFNIIWQRFTLDNWLNPFAKPQLTGCIRPPGP